MKTSRLKIAEIISKETLKGKISPKKLSREVAAYLLSENRVKELDSLLRDVQADWAKAGYLEVISSSAHNLTPSVKSLITRQVKQLYPGTKKIAITEVIDDSVLAGVRLNMASQQLDLSAKTKLTKLEQLVTSRKA